MTQKKVPQMSLCQCDTVYNYEKCKKKKKKSVSYKNNFKKYSHIYTVAQLRS